MRLTAWEMESRTDDPHRLTVDEGLEQSLNWWRVIRFPQPPLQAVPISRVALHRPVSGLPPNFPCANVQKQTHTIH